MLFQQIFTGLIALGFVVLVHEAGHFIAAIACGVEVQTFSIGWGPVLLRKRFGKTEYRISAFPLGGYCGMKGEHGFAEALEKKLDHIPVENGGFYSAHPLKRILISFAGPFANLLLAVLCFSLVHSMGLTYQTYGNRIIPAPIEDDGNLSPALDAGLETGDAVLRMDGTEIHTFADLQRFVSIHPRETIELEFERNGEIKKTRITPELDTKTGAGRIGVYPYVPLVVDSVESGSAAETTGIRQGDLITSVNGRAVSHYLEFESIFSDRPEQIQLALSRNNISLTVNLVVLYSDDNRPITGIRWQTVTVRQQGKNITNSLIAGFSDTLNAFSLTLKSIGLLFQGVDVSDAVSGPVRITMLIGEVAQSGMAGVLELLAIICISLFMMNLLPIPVLDGGGILFSLAELIKRSPLKPKTLYYVQFIGIAFIALLFIVAVFGDIQYLVK